MFGSTFAHQGARTLRLYPANWVGAATVGPFQSVSIPCPRAGKWPRANEGPIHTLDPVPVPAARHRFFRIFSLNLNLHLRRAPERYTCTLFAVSAMVFFFCTWRQSLYSAVLLCSLLHPDHTGERAGGRKGEKGQGSESSLKLPGAWPRPWLRSVHSRSLLGHIHRTVTQMATNTAS